MSENMPCLGGIPIENCQPISLAAHLLPRRPSHKKIVARLAERSYVLHPIAQRGRHASALSKEFSAALIFRQVVAELPETSSNSVVGQGKDSQESTLDLWGGYQPSRQLLYLVAVRGSRLGMRL